MPGIVGIISQKPSDECQGLVRSMLGSMEHECFYRSGTHFVPELGIYGGWVALEGSFAATQVFVDQQEDVALLFAGECFPDAVSRTGRNDDADARSGGDWLLRLYKEAGDRFFERLNGLFSGLLIDKRRRRAFLFNDRYGFERVYFCERNDGFYFASEAKALLRILPELRAFDESGVSQYLTFGCTLDWQTVFRGVKSLPGGSLWTFEGASIRKGRYFSPATWEAQAPVSPEAFESSFQETFKKVLPRYFDSQSKIGVSLTGGLDTRMVMACMPPGMQPAICYTFAGETGQTLDSRLAARVAAACGLEHRILRLGADFFSDFATHADRTVYITDGCSGVCGAHEIHLNRQGRRLAPVRLTGVFGSEVLRGMSTFKPIRLAPELFGPDSGRLVQPLAQRPSESTEHPITFAAFKEIPWNLFGNIASCRSQVSFRTPYLDNELVALAYTAPESLRKSPLSALRLVRKNSPALSKIPTDRVYVEQTAKLFTKLRRAAVEVGFKLDYMYNEGLPHRLVPLDPLLGRVHAGARVFGVHRFLPYRRWFRSELARYLQETLSDPQIQQSPFWNGDFVRQMAQTHVLGRKNYIREINTVLTLNAIERLLIRNHPKT